MSLAEVLPVLYKILLVLFYVILSLSLLSTMIGVPGNWILVGLALIVGLVTGFSKLTIWYFLLCVGLAVVGEIIESFLGMVVVAKRGGGKLGILGSFVGGIIGVILGSAFVPPLGSVLFGFVGAFAGAVLGELAKHRQMDTAIRIGFWSFVGRVAAIAGKLSVGCVILWIIITTTWP
ncbi:MAG: DUF456 domain-containing protein [Candidatus Latescibacterota bacterium]|nr:MAG: DUF456 domain-containing protein [Candidatus Latescibacterota bacterium]